MYNSEHHCCGFLVYKIFLVKNAVVEMTIIVATLLGTMVVHNIPSLYCTRVMTPVVVGSSMPKMDSVLLSSNSAGKSYVPPCPASNSSRNCTRNVLGASEINTIDALDGSISIRLSVKLYIVVVRSRLSLNFKLRDTPRTQFVNRELYRHDIICA